MTNYYVNGVQETTANDTNGQNMVGTDNLFVSATGEIVALGAADSSGVYLDDTCTNNNVTIDGEVYSAQGDGIYSNSVGLTLTVNGDIAASINGIHAGSTSSIFIGTQGGVSGGNAGILVAVPAAGSVVTVDGAVSASSGVGIDIYGDSNVSIGAAGNVTGATFGVAFEPSVTGGALFNAGLIDSSTYGVYLGGSAVEVDNMGTIAGSYDPVGINGANALIINSGTITGADGQAFMLFAKAGDTTIHNSGTIVGGLQDVSADGPIFIENSGKWLAPFGINGTGFDDTLNNSGMIHGALYMGTGSVTFTNSGQINGPVAFEGSSDQVDNSGLIHGAMTFALGDDITNGGIIHGAITLADSDTVVNSGLIQGKVTMGAGDLFDTGTGSVTGVITAATSDVFDFSGNFGHYKIADFATAGTTHDVLSFSGDDFTSYTELQSHTAQVGANVVITLDASDDIILLHTKLTALASHDFAFT